MTDINQIFNIHSLYNLSRYIYLKIEHNYSGVIEKSGITLPQLRVLWIIKSFSGTSQGEIAKIGCWSPPTVTKILKSLIENRLVVREESTNKKLYKLTLTEEGEKFIEINRQGNSKNFIFLRLLNRLSEIELNFLVGHFKTLAINEENKILIDYIEKINANSLKLIYEEFDKEDEDTLKKIVYFYNLLRVFILSVESKHRKKLLKFNLTYPQLRALWIIEAFPGITSAQLSEICFLSPSTSNLIVKNLYAKGLIYKEKSKLKNSLYLFISEKGEDLIIEDFKVNQNNLEIFDNIELLSNSELQEINLILLRINEALENYKVSTYIERTFEVVNKRLLIID